MKQSIHNRVFQNRLLLITSLLCDTIILIGALTQQVWRDHTAVIGLIIIPVISSGIKLLVLSSTNHNGMIKRISNLIYAIILMWIFNLIFNVIYCYHSYVILHEYQLIGFVGILIFSFILQLIMNTPSVLFLYILLCRLQKNYSTISGK